MPTTTPIFGWPIPTLSESADGPAALNALAVAIETTINDSSTTSYTPTWTADGSVQPTNPATKTGWYRTRAKICMFGATITFGASTTGGNGPLRLGIPLPAKAGITQTNINASLYNASPGNYDGQGEIRSGESTVLPRFLIGVIPNDLSVGYWQYEPAGGGGGATVPNHPGGGKSVANGGYIRVNGSYLTA